ncbi:MAG: ABC transporter permease, partial [Hyphomicrobiales bacterium]
IVGSLAGVLLLSMMINALVTLRIEFFWQSVASGVVIIVSVATYTWLQKKDRDGSGSMLSALNNPDNRKLAKLTAFIVGGLAVLALISVVFGGPANPSG